MSNVRVGDVIAQGPPLVVEVVGLAGVGKTALSQALCQRSGKIESGARPRIQELRYAPFFARNMLPLLPMALRQSLRGRGYTREELVMLARLRGWHRLLARQASGASSVILLDQGPVFAMSWLNGFGPEAHSGVGREPWWLDAARQWAGALDIVVALDAPDTVLMERINARSKSHAVKGRPQRETHGFLARGRTSMETIISRLAVEGGPRVLRFDTAQESPDQIVEKVLVAFGLEPSEERWSA